MNIGFFGDSILWGANDFKSGGYVEMLKSYFLKEKIDIDIYNRGISGEDTNTLLNHLENDLFLLKPEVIFFAIGVNDTYSVNEINNISLESFKKNISEIFSISKKFTNEIIFLEIIKVDETKTNPIPWLQDTRYENSSIKKYNNFIKEFCSKNNLSFLELNNKINLKDLDDGVHPNTSGHQKIFSVILKYISDFYENR